MKLFKSILFFVLGMSSMLVPVFLMYKTLEHDWLWLELAMLPIGCILLYKAGGLAVLGIAESEDDAITKSVRSDNGKPDPILTREFLEQYVEKHLVGIRKSIYDSTQRCHYAWYRTMSNGEKTGFIMYGDPNASGYVDIEGIFSFVEGANSLIGAHVAQILTPSAEAEAEFISLNQEADNDYNCSGGTHYWVVPTTSLKIGRADACRLLANLPVAGKSK